MTATITSVDDVLSRYIRYGRYQKALLVICGLGWFLDNCLFQSLWIILPHLTKAFSLNTILAGMLSSVFFIGMFIGSLFWGYLSDKIGRLRSFTLTLILSAVFGLLTAFATSSTIAFNLLFLGFAVGGHVVVDNLLFIEFLPPTHYYLLTLLSVFYNLGSFWASLVAYFFFTFSWLEGNWRYFLGILSLFNFALVACRFLFLRLYETPKWLLLNGKYEECDQVVEYVRTFNGGSESDRMYINYRNLDAESVIQAQPKGNRLILLLKQSSPIFTICLWLTWFAINFGYTMFNVFLPLLLESHHVSSITGNTYADMMIYTGSAAVAPFFATFLMKRVPGRFCLLLSCSTTAIALLLLGLTSGDGIIVALKLVLINFAGTTMYSCLYSYTPTLFTTNYRGYGNGIASAWGRIASIASPTVGGSLLLASSSAVAPLICSAVAIGVAGIAGAFVKSSK